jgi:hypothetical protein
MITPPFGKGGSVVQFHSAAPFSIILIRHGFAWNWRGRSLGIGDTLRVGYSVIQPTVRNPMPRIVILDPTAIYPEATGGYAFPGWTGETVHWPRNYGANLGQAGAYNFFLRGGYKPSIVEPAALAGLDRRDLLVVDLPLGGDAATGLVERLAGLGCRILFTGDLVPAATASGIEPPVWSKPSSAYNTIGLSVAGRSTPMQPANWGSFAFGNALSLKTAHPLFEIAGDRLSPDTALRTPIPGAALVTEVETTAPRYLLNAMPFSALQAWLQGQEDLSQWQGWNSRQHWLDDYVDILFDALRTVLDGHDFERVDLPPSTICFRHDNDDSVDPTFPALQEQEGVEATYALLQDENLPAWQAIRMKHPSHEYVLHYTTIASRYNLPRYARSALSLTPFRGLLEKYDVGRHVLGEDKLLKQVKAAKAAGISVSTLHRHFAYLPYPEIIDAFLGVYESDPEVIATSSFFRGNLYRWGMEELDGAVSSNAPWPDVQFPYWLPYRVAHAGRKGAFLRGWECTMMMEPEPDFVRQILTKRHRNLPQKFAMLCYHPSNTVKSPLIDGGTLPWVQSTIRLGRDNGYGFSRYDRYIAALNQAVAG